jgi:hypothetical protein
MYGGFVYWLTTTSGMFDRHEGHDTAPGYPMLATESWSGVVGGSGQCHVVTPYGYTLVADAIV